MTQVVQRNNHVLQTLKRLKETLENEKKKYADKVNVLVMTWERIAASAKEQRPLAAICIVEKMYKDTLGIMLQGDWPKMSPVSKTHLMQMLSRCRIDLCKEIPWLHGKFRKLLELVNDPWTLPSLKRILHKDPSPATPEQIMEFCKSERGLLIVMRLTMLCSNRCEKVAIRLAEACFGALSGGNVALLSLFTTNEYNFIFDIYLCLLYKYKKLECIINALKSVSVADGYYMVIRLRKRSDLHDQKIWKFSNQVAAVAARYFVTVSMLSRKIPNSALLKNLIIDWLSMCNPGENNVENEVRKVMQPAETSEHIYLMAEVLTVISQRLGNQMYSSLIMELYIRAVTADINYLERVKLQNDKEQMTTYEKHLASKFLALADLVKDHSGVRREFVLTAFSIHPSADIYRRVEEEAVASGKVSPHSTPTSQESIEVGVLSEGLSSLSSEEPEGKETATDFSVNNDSQDSGAFVEISNRCPLHLPYDGIGPEGDLCFQCGDFTGTQTPRNSRNQQQKKKERSLDALILIKGNTVTESLNYDVLSAPSQVLEAEKLGLSPQVCADLVTLLGSNRYHLLTWVLEWSELSSRCLRYMDEADTIKSGKKELKFLEIDYNQYKDWPENDDEGDCIEKGYEQWLEDDETDFDTDSKRSNTDDSEEMMIKTAIKRSQKQMGRYAESSSESDDSRSRPRNKKRGRPKKQKYFSDSGSVSDSLGSDGQKQKRLSKKHSAKSNDLRKTLGKLKVLEMAGDASHYLLNNDSLSSSMLNNKMFNVPNSNGARSDPTVLKSLRAFRPNAHKTRNDEFVQSMTENCLTSKQFCEKIAPINSTVFDCNDNRFVERFSLGNKDMELHFRTSGVRTIKYNDMIRTIKEDLMSVSNIPSVVNNPTVNVVHVHDYRNDAAQVFQSTADSSAPTRNVTAIQKPKSEESQGSQSRKPTSSQSLSQSEDTGEINRFHSTIRPSVSGLNVHNVSTSSGARPSARMTSPQYTTSRNQSVARHIPLTSNSALVNLLNAGTMRNEQNFNNQGARISAQSRIQLLDSRNSVEGDGNVANKNFTSQNIRTAAPTLFQHVVSINKNINTEEVLRGQNSSLPSFPENSHQNASRLPLEAVQASPSKPIKKTDLQKLLSESNSSLSTPKPGSSVKYTTANDVQFLNRNCPAKSTASFSKNSNVNTVKVPPQAKTNSLSSPTVILQTNASAGNKNPSDGTKRSHANPVVRVNNLGESNNSAIQESVSPRFTLINNFSNPSQLGGNAAFGSTSYTAPNVGSSQGTNTHEQVATTQTGGILPIGPPVSAEPTSSNRNILATVLKRNFTEKVTGSKYSETRNSDAVKNEVPQAVNQNAKSIRNTVPNPPQQNVIGRDNLNYVIGDMIERVVHQELNAASQSVMSPVRKPDYKETSQSTKRSGQDTQTDSDKKVKSSSSLPEVQTESGFIKKQVLNNQKITILVQNDGERDKPENVQKTKLNDVLFRDDQKTCITFRAIKRTQSEKSDESPVKKKSANGNRDGSSNPAKESKIMENSNGGVKAGESSSEPLCQYLVLEAINDPSGALPKFNQAFGKSYQIKIPQAVKPVESTEGGGGGSYDVIEQGKSESKIPNEQRATSLLVQNEVPVTASPREGNTFDIVQKPVKSVYIDKEIKQPAKSQERSKEGGNVSTIQMTEVQQPGANAYPNTTGKVARSSVVQQLLRKVPGPALQAVNSVNPLPARQVKAQDVVPSSTVFYATEACSQPQIVIQRTVGRVNTHNVGQVTQMAPVICTQSPSIELAPQTQTLLLAAVPTGTHGVVPGTQLVRLPPTSGVWKMAPTVSTFSPRIFQLRPQNLVLQGSQEQGLIMQSAQPVFLHHLTSLPLKPINVVPSETKTDKVDVKNDQVYIKPEPEVEEEKMCSGSLEMDSVKIKRENISPVPETSEHETVSLMKDIKEFENVFEETKLKFEMEEQQESIIQTNTPLTSGSNSLGQSVQQTVLVQPQLMLHKPQMIITSAIPNQQTIFTQKIEKPGEKEPEKTVIFATNTKIDNSDNSRSRVAVAYVNQAPQPAVSVQKPLVVVTNFSQATSPVPSVTSQNSSSPNSGISSVSFSGTSNSSSKTSTKSKSKHAKSVSILSKSPPAAKPQQKPQEDASTAQKIYAILEEYAVQLRNSPDMNNRPAPRRRSNPSSTSHPRKKKVSKSRESFSDGDETEPLPSSEDSSSNITVLQVSVSSAN